jgi:hypothetical protein
MACRGLHCPRPLPGGPGRLAGSVDDPKRIAGRKRTTEIIGKYGEGQQGRKEIDRSVVGTREEGSGMHTEPAGTCLAVVGSRQL